MSKKTIILAIILGAMVTNVFADPTITVSRTPGTYPPAPFSGEFTLTPNEELKAITGETGPFPSFCVEVHETLGPFAGSTYNVFVNDEAILGDGRGPSESAGPDGGDLLDPRTAFLYTQFRAGTLIGYDYTPGPGREASALALQTAIWYLEYEYGYTWDTLSPEGRAFVVLADTAYAGGWTTIGNVRVLNILNELNNKLVAQDMLVMNPPPECSLEVTKEACVITPGGNQCYKGNKVESITLKYTGLGCGASNHSQKSDKVICSGEPNGAEPVNIVVMDKKLELSYVGAYGILIGEEVVVDAVNVGKDKLENDILVTIMNADDDILQQVQFHTSCSQPLSVGDQFGSVEVISLTTTEGGTVGSEPGPCITELPATGADVEYTYTITNTGAVEITDVNVTDSLLGPIGTIAFIAPGEPVVLMLTVFLSDEATNTVFVEAAEGCTATATATITQEPAPSETVTITKAEYKADKDEFKVEATSSEGGNVTLTVVGFGEMTYDSGKDKYKLSLKPLGQLPPCTAVVTSSGGGSDSKATGASPCGDPTPQTTVPDVVGLTESAAVTAIEGATLVANTSGTAYSDTVPAGSVVSQDPAGGSTVGEGSTVNIVISLGPPASTTVPDVVGLTEAAAISAIEGATLVANTSAHAYSETVAAGTVIDQNPSGGATVDEGTTVSCTISDGPAPSETVTITKAEYKADKSEFKVEATSSQGGSVTLTVVGYGTMTWKADKSKYEYKAKPVADPGATVTVTSSGGGQDTKAVTHK